MEDKFSHQYTNPSISQIDNVNFNTGEFLKTWPFFISAASSAGHRNSRSEILHNKTESWRKGYKNNEIFEVLSCKKPKKTI